MSKDTKPIEPKDGYIMKPKDNSQLDKQIDGVLSVLVTKVLDHSTTRMPNKARMYLMLIEKANGSIQSLLIQERQRVATELLSIFYKNLDTFEEQDK
jgi:hypothetical protein